MWGSPLATLQTDYVSGSHGTETQEGEINEGMIQSGKRVFGFTESERKGTKKMGFL